MSEAAERDDWQEEEQPADGTGCGALPHMLRNGGGEDMRVQSLALARLLEKMAWVEKRLMEVPTRTEMREEVGAAIGIHCKSCDAARDDGSGAVLSLGKGGLSAKGRAGVKAALWIVGLIIGVILALGFAGPRLAELVAAWK